MLYIMSLSTPLFQFVECGEDLLKGAINYSPRLVNFGFDLFQFHLGIVGIFPRRTLMIRRLSGYVERQTSDSADNKIRQED